MGRVVYDQLELGTSDATDMNDIMSEIATQSAAVTAENLQAGGVDVNSIAGRTASVPALDNVVLNTVTGTQVLSTTWVTCDPGGINPIRSGGLGFTLNNNDIARIRGSVELRTTPGADGLPAGGQFDVRVGFQHNSGPVASTTPEVGISSGDERSARVPILAVIDGSAFAGTINFVELQVSDQSGGGTTVQYGRVQLQATVFKRAT